MRYDGSRIERQSEQGCGFLMALRSLSKAEREVVISRLLDDAEFGEDMLDIALNTGARGRAFDLL